MSSLTESIFGPVKTTTTTTAADGSHPPSLFDERIEIPIRKTDTTTTAFPSQNKNKRKSNNNGSDSKLPESTTTREQPENNKKAKASNNENVVPEKNDSTDAQENLTTDEHDEEVNRRTIFVGNLPLSTTRKTLAKLFADCGKIISTRIRNVAAVGISLPPELAGKQEWVKKISCNTKQFDTSAKRSISGYVVFENPDSVEIALQKNHTPVPDNDDDDPGNNHKKNTKNEYRHIRVDRVQATHDASRSVFVGNLPYHADEESLEAHFLGFLTGRNNHDTHDDGSSSSPIIIENVRIIRDKETQTCKGFGYVLFANATSIAHALRYIDGSTYMKREIRVRVCGKRYKNQHGTTTTTMKEKKKHQILNNTVGALQRVLLKEHKQSNTKGSSNNNHKNKNNKSPSTKKRVRGPSTNNKKGPNASTTTATTTGMSKRAAKHAKQTKRTKKLEKRITQGMGKLRKR